ncbi:MAG: 23S rRNA (adenine(2503)-C(2))-methyltransferase RlmN [Deltaproteobacteria bacterium]|nr:23S rRNA (adenine(2503)-C(2))-methyltransferase RlmN [Deltaproteobacteria bacterium]
MKNLRDFTYPELLLEVEALGERPYRAAQIYGWVFHRDAASIDSMTDISMALRERLKPEYRICGIDVLDVKRSEDGTRKFLSGLDDGARIESVLIPDEGRLTLCVSSQAGCALGCLFCMTGAAGFTRDLSLSELSGQVFAARGLLDEGERITNIVLMGMGEPLNNYDNVIRFLSVLTDGKGMGFSHNRVTVSTAGVVPAIKRFGFDANVNLAVSLNATTDEVRSRIMPINKKYPIAGLISALKGYPLKNKKYITIEYELIKGLNDTVDDARRLIRLLRGVVCKINLIPFNPFPGAAFERPDARSVDAFHGIVYDAGYTVIVRAGKGADIEAACGQLRARSEAHEAAFNKNN